MEKPALYVSEVDEATLDEMIARGVDLAKDEYSGTALGVLAANGMTEKTRVIGTGFGSQAPSPRDTQS